MFLERDGILNRAIVEGGNQKTPLTFDEFQVNSAAIEPLKQLKAAGFILLATTNQPGLSRGYQSRSRSFLFRRRQVALPPPPNDRPTSTAKPCEWCMVHRKRRRS